MTFIVSYTCIIEFRSYRHSQFIDIFSIDMKRGIHHTEQRQPNVWKKKYVISSGKNLRNTTSVKINTSSLFRRKIPPPPRLQNKSRTQRQIIQNHHFKNKLRQ